MKKIVINIFLVSTLMIGSVLTGAINVNTNNYNLVNITSQTNENLAELPLWYVGDSWIYSVEVEGEQGDSIDFDIIINNLKFEVSEVKEDIYNITLTVPKGDITGGGGIDLDILKIQGSLINTMMNGYLIVNKSTLKLIDGKVFMDGYIDKVIDIHFTIDTNLSFYNISENQTNFSSLIFPLNIG